MAWELFYIFFPGDVVMINCFKFLKDSSNSVLDENRRIRSIDEG